MRIAITQRVVHHPSYQDERDALSHDWIFFLEAVLPGCVIIPVPNNLGDTKTWLESVNPDAVILSSGNDLHSEIARDHSERQVMHWALAHGINLLGVCRGLQFVNCFFGGGLTLDLSSEVGLDHVGSEHDVVVSHPVFSRMIECAPAHAKVNSYHNHGVLAADLASGLTAFATSADGAVEGLIHDEKPVLAVQWHPERAGTDQVFGETLVRKFMLEGKFW